MKKIGHKLAVCFQQSQQLGNAQTMKRIAVAYAAGQAPVTGGFNLEDTHVITADGHDSFTTMSDNIFWK